MKLSPPSSLSSPSDPYISSCSSDLQDRLTEATASIFIGIDNDQEFIGLGQDPSLAVLSGIGMASPVMRVTSTENIQGGKQLLGDPTGKLADFRIHHLVLLLFEKESMQHRLLTILHRVMLVILRIIRLAL